MGDTVLVRYAEIGIKGNNRSMFENKLVDNIQACLNTQGIHKTRIERRYGRIMLHTSTTPDLSKVFGIASYSVAVVAGTTIESLCAEVAKHFGTFKTFRVTCYRMDKTFPIESREVARQLGSFIVEKTGAKVNLEKFEREFVVEILHGKLYFLLDTVDGPGGLPVGVEGTVLAYVDSKHAEEAALLVMKRGCDIVVMLPSNYAPKQISSYACGLSIKQVSGKNIDEIAKKHRAKAVVVGDTLKDFKDYDTTFPVFRPLVGAV